MPAIEFLRAARKDAARADVMRRARKLLQELSSVIATWDLLAWDVAIACVCSELEREATALEEDALVEFEDTDPRGIQL